MTKNVCSSINHLVCYKRHKQSLKLSISNQTHFINISKIKEFAHWSLQQKTLHRLPFKKDIKWLSLYTIWSLTLVSHPSTSDIGIHLQYNTHILPKVVNSHTQLHSQIYIYIVSINYSVQIFMISDFFFNRKRNILMKEKDVMSKEETCSEKNKKDNFIVDQFRSRTCVH